MKHREFWLIGGDGRQAALAGLLAADGHKVRAHALEGALQCEDSLRGIEEAGVVILPLPVTGPTGLVHTPLSQKKLSLEEVLDALSPTTLLMGGMVSPAVQTAARQRCLVLEDYFAREELALANAIPTAEGAIRLAMEALPVTIHGLSVVITGFGRLGQALAPRLRGLGADVTVFARRQEQRSLARVMCLKAVDAAGLKGALSSAGLVVNTIPAPVLGRDELEVLPKGAAVIELASRPGGVDDESAAALEVKFIAAPGLPGREAPITAAAAIRDTVYHILEG